MAEGVRTPVARLRAHRGAAILAYGFRPFFFLAGLSAVLGLGLWLVDLAGVFAIPTDFTPLTWHAHEMLFGFTVAVIAGFLLTAIPNWTGRLPLQGGPLLGLVLLWLAGRLAVAVSAVLGAWPAAAIDLAFLAALLFVVAREIVAGKNWRNLPMLAAIGALLVANGLMHAEALDFGAFAATGWRLAISIATLLIALIGGRIVPSFTRNWLAKRPGEAMPVPFGRLDRVALGATPPGPLFPERARRRRWPRSPRRSTRFACIAGAGTGRSPIPSSSSCTWATPGCRWASACWRWRRGRTCCWKAPRCTR